MSKCESCLMIVMVVVLANACTASNVPGCDAARIKRVLKALDSAQSPPASAATLRTLFEPTARVIAVSPAKTFDRTAREFIAEKAGSTDPVPLAYEFGAATITCNDERSANVVRRGCQVFEDKNDIFELTQTERLELVQSSGDWRITSMTSTLDAMSVNGRQLFQNEPMVKLESCTRAASKK